MSLSLYFIKKHFFIFKIRNNNIFFQMILMIKVIDLWKVGVGEEIYSPRGTLSHTYEYSLGTVTNN
jgi:hypothetical protein